LCSPKIGKRLRKLDALAKEVLLRSYRDEEWRRWFAAARTTCPPIRGPIFDSSIVMAHAAARGDGIALLPVRMFAQEIRDKRLVQPFRTEIAAGDYWLTALKSKRQTSGMQAFKTWLLKACIAK